MKNIKALIFACICCATMMNAQAQLMKEPSVDGEKRASFVVTAPDAKEVKLLNLSDDMALGAKAYDFEKGGDGKWTLTTNPCRPGLHYFAISVDGAKVDYPNSSHYFGWGKWTSMIEIPDDKLDFYLPKKVPHGEVHVHFYDSKTTQATRKCLVYTPPGYDQNLNVKYPVLYLQHGAGESELGWTMQGKVNFIMDNLIAAGKAKPFIIVMDNGYATRPGTEAEHQYNPGGPDNLFADLVTNELIPLIDASFRTLSDQKNRAIAGLSMGGGQALQIGFDHPELFGTVATFSGGGSRGNFELETAYNGLFKDAVKFNQTYRLFFVGCGTLEPMYPGMKGMVESLKTHGINTAFSGPVGSHEWQVWRVNMYDFAQMVFK
ncbi:MAG TPA: alpha/beta hydrolase-fold protein [Prolixibacteraceae bacterium]|jgi:enterochelin esterase family protein